MSPWSDFVVFQIMFNTIHIVDSMNPILKMPPVTQVINEWLPAIPSNSDSFNWCQGIWFSRHRINPRNCWTLATDSHTVTVNSSGILFVPPGSTVLKYSDGIVSKAYTFGWHPIFAPTGQWLRVVDSDVEVDLLADNQCRQCSLNKGVCRVLKAGTSAIDGYAKVHVGKNVMALLCEDLPCTKLLEGGLLTRGVYTTGSVTIYIKLFYADDLLNSFKFQHFLPVDDYLKSFENDEQFFTAAKLSDVPTEDVTLVTQFTTNRLMRFQALCSLWNRGPISVALYIQSMWNAFEFLAFITTVDTRCFENVDLLIVKPAYGTSCRSPYPINKLRNMAIRNSRTDFLLMIEVDLLPSADFHAYIKSFIQQYVHENMELPDGMKYGQPWALVVPALAYRQPLSINDYLGSNRIPVDFEQLVSSFRSDKVHLTDARAGHGPTSYELFYGDSIWRDWLGFSKPASDTKWKTMLKEICFETQWEPYYVLPKKIWLSADFLFSHPHVEEWCSLNMSWSNGKYMSIPLYDERFSNQGGDKQSHAVLLNALGFKFYVISSEFLIHLDHDHGMEGWPGSLKGQRDVASVESEVSVCNNSSFNYFDDYLAEMGVRFGRFFRWPGACRYTFVKEQKRYIASVLDN